MKVTAILFSCAIMMGTVLGADRRVMKKANLRTEVLVGGANDPASAEAVAAYNSDLSAYETDLAQYNSDVQAFADLKKSTDANLATRTAAAQNRESIAAATHANFVSAQTSYQSQLNAFNSQKQPLLDKEATDKDKLAAAQAAYQSDLDAFHDAQAKFEADHADAVKQLADEKSQFETERDAQRADLTAKKTDLEGQLAKLQEDDRNLHETASTVKGVVDSFYAANPIETAFLQLADEANPTNAELKAKVATLKGDKAALSANKKDLSSQRSSYNSQKKQQFADIDARENSAIQANKDDTAALSKLTAEKLKFESDKKKFFNDRAAWENTKSTSYKTLAANKAQLVQDKAAEKQHEDELNAQLQADRDAFDQEKSDWETEKAALEQEISDIQAQVDELQSKVNKEVTDLLGLKSDFEGSYASNSLLVGA